MKDEENRNLTRRAALEKLAKVSVYTAPTVTALLIAEQSYAQTSATLNDPANANNSGVLMCLAGNRNNLTMGLGNNAGGAGRADDPSDCNI